MLLYLVYMHVFYNICMFLVFSLLLSTKNGNNWAVLVFILSISYCVCGLYVSILLYMIFRYFVKSFHVN